MYIMYLRNGRPLVQYIQYMCLYFNNRRNMYMYVVALGKPLLPHAWLPLTSLIGINMQINDILALYNYCHL